MTQAPAAGRPSVLARPDLEPTLARLADRHGVATSYADQAGRAVAVPAETVVAVLAALGVDASSPAAARDALRGVVVAALRRLAPPVVVARAGATSLVDLRPREGAAVRAELVTADGARRAVPVAVPRGGPRQVSGERRETRAVVLDGVLPVGWHELRVSAGPEEAVLPVAVAPYRLPEPPRCWGWSVQLYATRSSAGWGVGDLADLAELARWSGTAHGAAFLLVNPLHAVAPVPPLEPSPYSPASRRFVNPLYLRVSDVPAYRAADPELRREIDGLRPDPAGAPDRIDRDRTWLAQQTALRRLFDARPPAPGELERFRAETPGVDDFAAWCVLAAEHGPDYRTWPAGLRRPAGSQVADVRRRRAADFDFQVWLQALAAEQLDAAQQAARRAGQPIGIVHDLAVGVSGGGADAWALQDVLAGGVTIGAPPDDFNQAGQDWGLPPWQPAALRDAGYAPFRDIVRAAVRHGGGLRVDHVLGLFRLWWVPAGGSPADGSYVRYRADELLGVLALEAALAGAVVVGEDLGTVPPRVRRALADRGILGSSVLWFEREEGRPRPPEGWRRLAAASVTTHDLPTAAGFLIDEQVRLRDELGLLRRPAAQERAAAARERQQLLDLLVREGLLADPGEPGGEPDPAAVILALYLALARSPSRLLVAALADAVGDLRQPNLPGTTDGYPNWQLPLAEPDGSGGHRPLGVEELEAHPGPGRLAAALRVALRTEAPGAPEAPTAPGAPGAPGAPTAPGAPGAPGAPTAPGAEEPAAGPAIGPARGPATGRAAGPAAGRPEPLR